jgi:hypothetical protein
MKFSMAGQEKGDLLIQFTAIEVTAWAGLTVYTMDDNLAIHNTNYSLAHKFVRYLRQIAGFLQGLGFPPPIKLTAMI